jgi:hypothetical protein
MLAFSVAMQPEESAGQRIKGQLQTIRRSAAVCKTRKGQNSIGK